jgi:branched-subunit amino acid transport protein AzlD
MNAALKTLRIHLLPGPVAVLWPWLILAISFFVNLAIYALTDVPLENRQTGGIASLYCVAIFANLSLWTQVFPLAIGLGSTRRSFFHGTCLYVLGQAVLAGVVLTALHALEGATGGWGVHMRFFSPGFLEGGNPVELFLTYTVPFLCVSALGMLMGTVFKRWGQNGMYSLSTASLLLGCGAAVLLTWRHAWGAVGRFFTDTDLLALTSGYPLVLAVALGAAAWVVLRRVTP